MNEPVLGILIPEDSRDPIESVTIEMTDGGLAAITWILEGEPDEFALPGRLDVVALVREDAIRSDAPRNLRATRLLRKALPVGGWVAGPCLLAGQKEDTGLIQLPRGVNTKTVCATLSYLKTLDEGGTA